MKKLLALTVLVFAAAFASAQSPVTVVGGFDVTNQSAEYESTIDVTASGPGWYRISWQSRCLNYTVAGKMAVQILYFDEAGAQVITKTYPVDATCAAFESTVGELEGSVSYYNPGFGNLGLTAYPKGKTACEFSFHARVEYLGEFGD